MAVDPLFDMLLQSVTDAVQAPAPAVTPSLVQSTALSLMFPANDQTEQQVPPSVQTGAPQTVLPVLPPSPDVPPPQDGVPQQSANPAQQTAALPPTPAAQQAEPVVPSEPVVPQQPADQQPVAQQPSAQQPTAQQPTAQQPTQPVAQQPSTQQQPAQQQQSLPELPAQPAQSASAQPAPQTTPAVPQATPVEQPDPAQVAPQPNNAVAAQVSPPVPSKSHTAKADAAAQPQDDTAKSDTQTADNAAIDALASFLLPQIEPVVTPANDATADTADTPVKKDDQGAVAPAAAQTTATAQNFTPPPAVVAQPPAVAAQPAAAEVPTPGALQTAAIDTNTTSKPNPAPDQTADAAQKAKPAVHQAASTQPVFVPANDTAPPAKPELQSIADPRTPSTPDAPQTAPANTTAANTATHQAPAIATMATPIPMEAAPSGLRKLTAGLQVAAQEQDVTSSLGKLGVTIAAKSIDGLRHFDIRLDPPELGRVQVQLTTDDAGRAQANIVVDKPQTLDLLQRDSQNLNRALSDAGLNVSDNGLNFSLREQYRQNDGSTDQGRSQSLSVKAVVQTDATQIHSSLGSYAPNSVRLDIRV